MIKFQLKLYYKLMQINWKQNKTIFQKTQFITTIFLTSIP